MRWYRAGADVQSNLPRLAIYMGHVSIVSTAHYLHFIPAMRQLARRPLRSRLRRCRRGGVGMKTYQPSGLGRSIVGFFEVHFRRSAV